MSFPSDEYRIKKNGESTVLFNMWVRSVDPPDLALQEDANEVDDPNECSTGNHGQDGKNDSYGIVLIKAAKQTNDAPNDIKRGNAKDKLDDPRQFVHGFDEVFHCETLQSLDLRYAALLL